MALLFEDALELYPEYLENLSDEELDAERESYGIGVDPESKRTQDEWEALQYLCEEEFILRNWDKL